MIRWLLAAGMVFVLSVAWHLPASWVIKRLSLPEDVPLEDIAGSWRHGHAQVRWQGHDMGAVEWRLSALLSGPTFETGWRMGASQVKGRVKITTQGVCATGVSGSVRADVLNRLLSAFEKSFGQLLSATVRIGALNGCVPWGGGWFERVSGRGDLDEISVVGMTLPQLHWSVKQAHQPVRFHASGAARWGTLDVDAELRPVRWQVRVRVVREEGADSPPPASLTTLLSPDGSGVWRGQWQGRWK